MGRGRPSGSDLCFQYKAIVSTRVCFSSACARFVRDLIQDTPSVLGSLSVDLKVWKLYIWFDFNSEEDKEEILKSLLETQSSERLSVLSEVVSNLVFC